MKPFFFYSLSNFHVGGDDLKVITSIFGEENMGTTLNKVTSEHIVIPRFRAIPFGKDLEQEVTERGAQLINTYHQHRNIADIDSYAYLLGDLTAPVFHLEDLPDLPEGEYFVKGETNSIKKNWLTSAYAKDKKGLVSVVGNVMADQYVGSQKVIIRPFRAFRKIDEAVNGQPVFNERRVFILDGEVVSEGFYWSGFDEPEIIDRFDFDSTLHEAIERTKHLSRFYVIDLAEFEDGSWEVVELNDGPMSGLSDNDCSTLWSNVVSRLRA